MEGNLLLYVLLKTVIELTVKITEGYHCYQLQTKFYPVYLSQS